MTGKRLEFDIVLLLGADEGKMPHFGSGGDQEKLDEDRRKFYVSVTRARKEVHIFHSGFDDRYGKMRRNGPSRFLQQLALPPDRSGLATAVRHAYETISWAQGFARQERAGRGLERAVRRQLLDRLAGRAGAHAGAGEHPGCWPCFGS